MKLLKILLIGAGLSTLPIGMALADEEQALGAPCVVEAYLRAREATLQAEASPSDVDRLIALVAADMVYEHPRVGITITGADAFRDGLSAFLGATDDGRYQVIDYLVSAGTVAISLNRKFKVRDGEEWLPRSVRQLIVFEVKDGKISRIIDYW
ncbi:MAG: nuclear transport factor 2 family protein [Proteobacteria bacterium]|nr:nuclear transport factor 2 family protein [Pseudomonadota bacterium]